MGNLSLLRDFCRKCAMIPYTYGELTERPKVLAC